MIGVVFVLCMLVVVFRLMDFGPGALFLLLLAGLIAMGSMYLMSGGGQLPPFFYLVLSANCIVGCSFLFVVLLS